MSLSLNLLFTSGLIDIAAHHLHSREGVCHAGYLPIGSTHRMKRNDPSTEPGGTPKTNSDLMEDYEFNQANSILLKVIFT